MELNNATAIITGAARGLGLEFAQTILAAGGRVLMTDLDGGELKRICAQLKEQYPSRVHSQMQNVKELGSFCAAFDTANLVFHPHQVNVLINNAGAVDKLLEFYKTPSVTSWTNVIEVNLIALMRGTQVYVLSRTTSWKSLSCNRSASTACLRHRASPVIINVASMAGIQPPPQVPAYAMSKLAAVSFTKMVGKMTKRTNVRVVALCPAFVDTDMGQLASDPKTLALFGGFMTKQFVAQALVKCLVDANNSGNALMVTKAVVAYHEEDTPSKL